MNAPESYAAVPVSPVSPTFVDTHGSGRPCVELTSQNGSIVSLQCDLPR